MAGNLCLTLILVITIGFTLIGLSEGTPAKKNGDDLKCSRCNNTADDGSCFKNPTEPENCGRQDDFGYVYVYCDVLFPYGGVTNKKEFGRGCLYTKKDYEPQCFIYVDNPGPGEEKFEKLQGVKDGAKVCICSDDGCNNKPYDPEDETKWPEVGKPFPAPDPTTVAPTDPPVESTAPGGGNNNPGDTDGVECLQSMSFLLVLNISLATFFALKNSY